MTSKAVSIIFSRMFNTAIKPTTWKLRRKDGTIARIGYGYCE